MFFKKAIFAGFITISFLVAVAQPKKMLPKDSALAATVNVTMTNSAKVPQKGEQIIFLAVGSKKMYKAATDARGKLTMKLPPGDNYTLKLKSLNDTTQYNTMKIPALQPGQYFTDPFAVTIVYDPPVNFTLNNVEFDVNKATLRPASFKELDELADYLKWKDGETIEIAGHTDNVGKPEDNLKLSQQRAEAVKAYLIKKGIPVARVSAKGYGDTQPVADNGTTDGRQKNRRTEARLKS
jgi:outer membrane protein OmpA-like peptidoglycan-associated protein